MTTWSVFQNQVTNVFKLHVQNPCEQAGLIKRRLFSRMALITLCKLNVHKPIANQADTPFHKGIKMVVIILLFSAVV